MGPKTNKNDEKLKHQLVNLKGTDNKLEVLKNHTTPLLGSPDFMIQYIFNIVGEEEVYEIICLCFPAFKKVDSNSVKPSILIYLFFLIWVTYIAEITQQTVEMSKDLNNEELATSLALYANNSYTKGMDNLEYLKGVINP